MSAAPDETPRPETVRPGRSRRGRSGVSAFSTQMAAAMPHPWVTYAIVAANAAVFVVMVASGVSPVSPNTDVMFAWGADFGPSTARGEWWRLVTCTFLHFGGVHLALNLWCLCVAAPLAERLLGHGVFAVVYFFSAVLGSLTSIAWDPYAVAAGASGAVFGTYGALFACSLALRGKVPVTTFEHLRLSAVIFVLGNVVYGLAKQGIDHAAHVGGLLGGFAGTWMLCRPPVDSTPRSPLLRVDRRFVVALIAVLAVGVCAAAWRVDNSAFVRIQVAWEKMLQAEAAGRFDEALEHTDTMLALAPTDADLHCRRAYYLGSLGRHEEALAAADGAVALDATQATYHSNRAWSLAALSRHEEGVRAAEQALSLDPRLLIARYNLIDCLDELGHNEDLLREAKVVVEQDRGNVNAHTRHSWALRKLGRFPEALAAVEQALAIEPGHTWSLEQRSWLLQKLGK